MFDDYGTVSPMYVTCWVLLALLTIHYVYSNQDDSKHDPERELTSDWGMALVAFRRIIAFALGLWILNRFGETWWTAIFYVVSLLFLFYWLRKRLL